MRININEGGRFFVLSYFPGDILYIAVWIGRWLRFRRELRP